MTRIVSVDLLHVDLPPPVPRSDAIQSFVTQETPFVRITCSDGSQGIGYSYTIGTGGSSVMALLRDHLAPRLIGRDPALIEEIWRELMFFTHATTVGAITSLALAAIDTALWDWRCRRDGQPLWVAAGGAKKRIPVYTTEGGWLHLPTDQIVEQTLAAQAAGFKGAKIKVGQPHVSQDVARLKAVRAAVGDSFEILQFNTPVAALMELSNAIGDIGIDPAVATEADVFAVREAMTALSVALAPYLTGPVQLFIRYDNKTFQGQLRVRVPPSGFLRPPAESGQSIDLAVLAPITTALASYPG